MPRVLKIDSITHRPICKTAGAGGFSGHNYLCHSKARIGVTGQCKKCTIPFFESGVSIDKMVGCGDAVPCGSNVNGTGWDFDLEFGKGSSYAATKSNTGDGSAADEWASVRFTGANIYRIYSNPFTYKWSTGSTSAGVTTLAPGAAGTYSVTVTDKNGKGKTKEMPAIYTRFITWPALETLLGANSAYWGVLQGDLGQAGQKLTQGLILEFILAADTTWTPAVLGGKGPFLVGIHAITWEHANDNDPDAHAEAEAATIKLGGGVGGAAAAITPTAGNDYLTEVSPPGNVYKAVFHTSTAQDHHHALPALNAVDPNNPGNTVWSLKGGGTVDWTNGNNNWNTSNQTQTNKVDWHISIRDSEKQGVHVLRMKIADIIA